LASQGGAEKKKKKVVVLGPSKRKVAGEKNGGRARGLEVREGKRKSGDTAREEWGGEGDDLGGLQ